MLSIFAFNFNLRRYNAGDTLDIKVRVMQSGNIVADSPKTVVRVEFGTTVNAQMATKLGALPAITQDGVIAFAEVGRCRLNR